MSRLSSSCTTLRVPVCLQTLPQSEYVHFFISSLFHEVLCLAYACGGHSHAGSRRATHVVFISVAYPEQRLRTYDAKMRVKTKPLHILSPKTARSKRRPKEPKEKQQHAPYGFTKTGKIRERITEKQLRAWMEKPTRDCPVCDPDICVDAATRPYSEEEEDDSSKQTPVTKLSDTDVWHAYWLFQHLELESTALKSIESGAVNEAATSLDLCLSYLKVLIPDEKNHQTAKSPTDTPEPEAVDLKSQKVNKLKERFRKAFPGTAVPKTKNDLIKGLEER